MLLVLILSSLALSAQSFYTLTGVKTYEPIVIIEGKGLEVFEKDITSLMQVNALELDVNTTGHSSRVLAFIVNKFSLGDTLGVRVILELGEYVKRKGSKEEVFVISYVKVKIFPYNEKELEDDLADTVEEMLEIFATQHIDDNKKLSEKKKSVRHETFDKDMAYENNYERALLKAKKEAKDLMVFMTTSYCPWCRKLENKILSQEHIDKKIKATHVPVVLNYDKKEFPKELGKIRVTPTLYVLNAKTQKIEETFIGFSSRNRFLNYLKNKDEK